MSIEKTLQDRETMYGPYSEHARIEAALDRVVNTTDISRLSDVQLAGLRMIMHKIARILNAGYNNVDNWHDIAGYATLVEKDLTVALDNPGYIRNG